MKACPVCSASGDDKCVNQRTGRDMWGRHKGREEKKSLFRRAQPEPEPKPVYTVQLHRMVPEGDPPRYVIGSSWAPTEVEGLEEARAWKQRLMRDNGWGGADMFPNVTITDSEGNIVY